MTNCVIVVPCYNEGARFPVATFRDFLRQKHGISFIVVNDGSKDNTMSKLQELRDGFEDSVRILDKPVNGGKGEAVRDGMLLAFDTGGADIIGFWDADLATPLDAICDLLREITARPGIQMIFGSRVKLLGRHVERRAIRHYLGRVFATVVSVLLGLPIYDTQCGAKLFRATPEMREIFKQPFSSRWVFDVEMIVRFIRLRNGDMQSVRDAIYEYPLHTWRDIAGSKVRPKDFLRAFGDVAHIYLRYLRRP